jgi:hypothetical protein
MKISRKMQRLLEMKITRSIHQETGRLSMLPPDRSSRQESAPDQGTSKQ